MVQVSYPGVYIQKKSNVVRSITMRSKVYFPMFTLMLAMNLVLCSTAYSQREIITVKEDGKGKFESKMPVNLIPNVIPMNAAGKATTTFSFHPDETQDVNFSKNFNTNIITPNPFTANYFKTELHGTTGSATYNLNLGQVMEGGIVKQTIGGALSGFITPGNNADMVVKISGAVKDPITFSNDPEAQFPFHPEGLNTLFSLLSGTAFPAVFAPNLQTFGAIADDTSMVFEARVVPDFISDPDAFWSDSLNGNDLYNLTITSDINHTITARLISFGTAISGFSVDPHSSMEINAIQSAIAANFNPDGTLKSDLTDLFTAGFIPLGNVTEFTLGFRNTLNLGVAEVATTVPEPSSLALLSIGGLYLLGYACYRRKRATILLISVQN